MPAHIHTQRAGDNTSLQNNASTWHGYRTNTNHTHYHGSMTSSGGSPCDLTDASRWPVPRRTDRVRRGALARPPARVPIKNSTDRPRVLQAEDPPPRWRHGAVSVSTFDLGFGTFLGQRSPLAFHDSGGLLPVGILTAGMHGRTGHIRQPDATETRRAGTGYCAECRPVRRPNSALGAHRGQSTRRLTAKRHSINAGLQQQQHSSIWNGGCVFR